MGKRVRGSRSLFRDIKNEFVKTWKKRLNLEIIVFIIKAKGDGKAV